MSHRHARAAGFTLIELLVVIGIIILLIGLIVPVIGQLRGLAKLTDCRTKVTQINMAMRQYMDNHQTYPSGINRNDLIKTDGTGVLSDILSESGEAAKCPLDRAKLYNGSDKTSYFGAFGGNENDYQASSGIFLLDGKRKATAVRYPSQKMIVADAIVFTSSYPASNTRNHWHNKTSPLQVSMGFADGSVKTQERKTSPAPSQSFTNLAGADVIRDPYY